MAYKITALFVDSRREFPHQFSEMLWPQIQFSEFDRVGRISEAFQQHLSHEFNMCFISDRLGENLDDFFVDIAKLGRNKTCIFVKVDSKTPAGEAAIASESGFHLAVHEQMTEEDHKALQGVLGVIWHKVEVDRRSDDLDGLVNVLMRVVDEAAISSRRGHPCKLQHGATSLVRMHAEFDTSILDAFMQRLSACTEEAEPVRKTLKSIPLPLLNRKIKLPALTEEGYQGASSRVFSMLVDKFGESIAEVSPEVLEPAAIESDSVSSEAEPEESILEQEAGE